MSPALLAAAATGVQVGAAMVVTRFVIEQTTPIPLAMLRYALGFLTLLPAVLVAHRSDAARGSSIRIAGRDLLPIALLGIGQFGLLIALLNYGLQFIPSARAALIFATFPLLTLLLASAMGIERMTLARTTGVLIAIAGVGFALAERLGGSAERSAWIGDVAVFASTLAGAICSVLYRPYLRRYPTLPVSALAMLASVVVLAMLSAHEGFFSAPPHFTPGGWAAIVFIGISSGVGYFLWLYALGHASPTRVTVFLSLSPITAALLGAWLLDEPLTTGLAIGSACVVAGLFLATREPGGG